MSLLPVTLACASAITVFGTSPIIGDRFRRGIAGKNAITGKKDEPIFERALVLMDLPACASGTVELVARIPGIGEAILLDVIDAAGSSGAAWITGRSLLSPRDRAKMRLVAHKNYLEELGTPAHALVELDEDNDTCGTFLGVASRENASLVVMRSEPMSRLRSAFMENYATRVLRKCTMRDMLIYPAGAVEKAGEMQAIPPKKNMFARILCPTDLSSFSHETLAWAARIDAVSEIILLHVLPAQGTNEHGSSRLNVERKMAGIKAALSIRISK